MGAINVLYGSPTGLSGWDDHYFGQNTSRVAGIAHVDDEFGAAVAVGDIDGDGYDDVVVGSPQEYYWPNARYCARYSCGQVGAINVLYGSADGVQPLTIITSLRTRVVSLDVQKSVTVSERH